MMRSRSGGRSARTLRGGGGGSRRIAELISTADAPPNGRLPGRELVEHDAEREQVGPRVRRLAAQLLGRHVRASCRRPGQREEIGESIVGACVAPGAGASAASLASPKSSTLIRPSFDSMTFAGFRSRCTTPFWCAAASASASGIARSRRRASGSPPAVTTLIQRLALDQLHREEADAPRLLDRVQRRRCSGD